MALWDEVVARYSDKYLIGLTNPDVLTDDASIDQPRADAAVLDAESDFLVRVQEPYDNANPRHVAAGVKGVVGYLQSRGTASGEGSRTLLEEFWADLDRLAENRRRNRANPVTNSTVRPKPSRREHPEFDERNFLGVIPSAPSRGGRRTGASRQSS